MRAVSTSCETSTCETCKQNTHRLRSVVKRHTADLLSPQPRTFLMGNRCVRVMNLISLSLSFDKGPCCLVTGHGVTSPQYLLSVIAVRFSGADRPEWFPCRFDGHLFDLPSFPWLPFAVAWNPRRYLSHHFLGPMCLAKIRHANISGAPKHCAIWLWGTFSHGKG